MNSPRLRTLIDRLEKCVEEIEKTETATVCKQRIDVESIVATVSEFFGLTPRQLRLRCREHIYCWPRHIALYLTRRHTKLSLHTIASQFGYRDHGIVLHAVRRVQDAIDVNDLNAREDIGKLTALLQSKFDHERLQQPGNLIQKPSQVAA